MYARECGFVMDLDCQTHPIVQSIQPHLICVPKVDLSPLYVNYQGTDVYVITLITAYISIEFQIICFRLCVLPTAWALSLLYLVLYWKLVSKYLDCFQSVTFIFDWQIKALKCGLPQLEKQRFWYRACNRLEFLLQENSRLILEPGSILYLTETHKQWPSVLGNVWHKCKYDKMRVTRRTLQSYGVANWFSLSAASLWMMPNSTTSTGFYKCFGPTTCIT